MKREWLHLHNKIIKVDTQKKPWATRAYVNAWHKNNSKTSDSRKLQSQ